MDNKDENFNIVNTLFSEDLAIALKQLDQDLLQIEQEYHEFFNDRPPVIDSEKHDRLSNHYIYIIEPPRYTFMIKKESDLPVQIRRACLMAFENIFKGK
jgi:hypothetical protein